MNSLKTRFTIYHNPHCSKSRATLALLRENGIEPEIVEYLKNPLEVGQLAELAALLGVAPHALLRTKEDAFKKTGLSASSTPEEILRAIAENPVLLERPIVVSGGRAVIGRPPENVRSLF